MLGLLAVWAGGWVFLALVAFVSRHDGLGAGADADGRAAGLALPLGLLGAGVIAAGADRCRPGFALPFLLAPAMVGDRAARARTGRLFSVFALVILVAGWGLLVLRDDYGFAWMLWLVAGGRSSPTSAATSPGRFIGGPKFWPRVSPKKTWAGTVAGWIGAALSWGWS